jgi:hypothetical protein
MRPFRLIHNSCVMHSLVVVAIAQATALGGVEGLIDGADDVGH